MNRPILPKNIYWVRHGQSELNAALKMFKEGKTDVFDGPVGERHGSKYRLTDLGREQAKMARDYIKSDPEIQLDATSAYYVSEFVRAKETAALLELPDAAWKVEYYLRERDYGDFEVRGKLGNMKPTLHHSFYSAPPNGDSIASTCLRVDRVLSTMAKENTNQNVIAVCHGEFMWGVRCRLEKLGEEGFMQLEESPNPHDHIWNCQILHYSRFDADGKEYPHYVRFRSICPTDLNLSSNEWQPILRNRRSNEELLKECEQYPVLLHAVT